MFLTTPPSQPPPLWMSMSIKLETSLENPLSNIFHSFFLPILKTPFDSKVYLLGR